MKLGQLIALQAGGPGSGCRGDNCGRPSNGDTTPPSKDELTQYLEGDCSAFAVAAHELTGYPLFRVDTEDDSGAHVMVGIPGTTNYIDVAGVVNEKDIRRRYFGDEISIHSETPAHVYGMVMTRQDIKDAAPLVQRVLNRIKEFTSTVLPAFKPVPSK